MRKILFSLFFIIWIPSLYAEELVRAYHWADGGLCYKNYKIPNIIFKDDTPALDIQDNYCSIEKIRRADLNKDGREEYIIAAQLKGIRWAYPDGTKSDCLEEPFAAVFICTKNGAYLKIERTIITGDIEPDFELSDMNNNGKLCVIAKGFIVSQWQYLAVVTWETNHYETIFQNTAIGKHYVIIQKRAPLHIKVVDGLVNEMGRHMMEYPIAVEDWVWSNNGFIKIREAIKPGSDKSFIYGKNIWRFEQLSEETFG